MIIHEHFITAFNDDLSLKERYVDEVWEILQLSYKPLGGLLGFNSSDDLLKTNTIWKMVTRNSRVVAVAIYKTAHGGRKLVAGGSDGTIQGKKDFYTICYEDVKMVDRQTWGEVSDSLEGILLFKYNAVPIPVDIVNKTLKSMRQPSVHAEQDGFHYMRDIYGKSVEKIMFGNVPPKYRNTTDWNNESTKYRNAFNKYNTEHPEDVNRRKNKHNK